MIPEPLDRSRTISAQLKVVETNRHQTLVKLFD